MQSFITANLRRNKTLFKRKSKIALRTAEDTYNLTGGISVISIGRRLAENVSVFFNFFAKTVDRQGSG